LQKKDEIFFLKAMDLINLDFQIDRIIIDKNFEEIKIK
jgi:hypothetical protein